jgi:anti-sigma factor RsiW
MDRDLQLKLQAYLDGELPEAEAREVAELLRSDAAVSTLFAELRTTRNALVGFEADIKLPESREFYWSKIEREICRLEKCQTPRSETSLFAAWRRFLVPAGAMAALVILGFLALPLLHGPRVTASAEAEFTLADSDTFTYQDYANGTTLVWLSYPAENEFTEADSEDTLD